MKIKLIWLMLIASLFSQIGKAQISDEELAKLIASIPKLPDDTNKLKNLSKISEFCAESDFANYNEMLGALGKKLLKSDDAKIQFLAKNHLCTYYNNLGYINAENFNFNASLQYFDECIPLAVETNNIDELSLAYNNIGAIYDRVNEVNKALIYYAKSYELAKKNNRYKGMAIALHNMSVLYGKKNEVEKELRLLKTTERFVIKYKLEISNFVPTTLLNIGKAYLKLRDTLNAVKYYNKSLALAQSKKSESAEADVLSNLARLHIIQGKYQNAKTEAERSISLGSKYDDYKLISNSANILKKIYTKEGNYVKAYQYIQLEMNNDSLYRSKENDKAVMRHQFKSEYELKEAIDKAEQDKKEIKEKNIRNSITGVLCGSLIFLTVVYRQRNKIAKAKKRSEELLLNILPYEVAEELKQTGTAEAKQIESVTVLFTDFKGFTSLSEKVSAKQLVKDLHECFTAFDQIMLKHGMEKIKTIGDSYMAAGGIPIPNETNAVDAVNAALEIKDFIEKTKQLKLQNNEPFFDIRIGVHTGPVVAGIVGIKKFSYDIWGDTVNTASRLESSAEVGKVNISEATYEKVKDKFNCVYRGEIEAKGKGKLRMYFVEH